MSKYFADLHIHIGRSGNNKPVKITASRDLTFANIANECVTRKGIDIAGIIDCMSPNVILDIKELINKGEATELDKGGLIYKNKLCIILGAEIETAETTGSAHNLCFFSHLRDMEAFSKIMSNHIHNITLSSQRANLKGRELLEITESLGGTLIPAHIFTPHKSYYGNCTDRLEKCLGEDGLDRIPAVELGLSSDTYMSDFISELEPKTFLSNSDAHSLPKIAREYNLIEMNECNFEELIKALESKEGRKVLKNYGLDPRLGKYHRTYCEKCGTILVDTDSIVAHEKCPNCGSTKTVTGVFDRIMQIKDKPESVSPKNRPEYIHQIPLEYIPKLGKKGMEKLISHFGTEMNILHKAELKELAEVVGDELAQKIISMRSNDVKIVAGGGGIYGKVE